MTTFQQEATMPETTDEMRLAFLKGAYDMCDRLLTSPRMNRPQRELITDQAMSVKAQGARGMSDARRAAPLPSQGPS